MLSEKSQGFTLIEFMVIIAVSAILIVVALPAMYSFFQNNRVITFTNKLVASFNYARAESIKRGSNVIVCSAVSSMNFSSCGTANDWSNGWVVFTDADGDLKINSKNDVLRVGEQIPGNIKVSSVSSNQVIYNGSGFLNGASFQMQISADGCTGRNARQIDISPSGRVSVTQTNC